MNINILIPNYFKEKGKLNVIFEIDDLIFELKNNFNFTPKVYDNISSIEAGIYYLFFQREILNIDPILSKNIIFMNATLSSFSTHIEKYDFAAIIQSIIYIQRSSLICGKIEIAKTLNWDIGLRLSKDYCFMSNKDEKGLLNFIVRYLFEYDQLIYG